MLTARASPAREQSYRQRELVIRGLYIVKSSGGVIPREWIPRCIHGDEQDVVHRMYTPLDSDGIHGSEY